MSGTFRASVTVASRTQSEAPVGEAEGLRLVVPSDRLWQLLAGASDSRTG